jgi:hypothetical protein
MAKFEYTKIQYVESDCCHSGKEVFRPVINVILENDGHFSGMIPCLVDSGADWCMFPLEMLEQLGIDHNDLGFDYSHGFAAENPIYFTTVRLHNMELGFWDIEAGFTAFLNGESFGMVGHTGFFDRCKVLFDRPRLNFEIIRS